MPSKSKLRVGPCVFFSQMRNLLKVVINYKKHNLFILYKIKHQNFIIQEIKHLINIKLSTIFSIIAIVLGFKELAGLELL